ncbi:unnamed protein product [Mytilus edulis]|uniref:Uncharacterized protein n=1 Tax=Mytilus edulis TaxID=6550 RepID=A0A8S3STP4_MYTED|nr:unnamed protein product [Mytilus edulis]
MLNERNPKDSGDEKEVPGSDQGKEITQSVRDDPNYDRCMKYVMDMKKQIILDNNDAYRAFLNCGTSILTPAMFGAYPQSPTAQQYFKAFKYFFKGWFILHKYSKSVVESEEDCEFLKPAFHAYSNGEMTEHHLFSQFQPPDNTPVIIDQYLKLRPSDIFAKYCKVILVHHPNLNKKKCEHFSDFEFQKNLIVTGEKFIHKRSPYVHFSEVDKSMVKSLYYKLGAIYVTTSQGKRALNSFQKSYDLDKTNVSALYGIAFQCMEIDPDKAISLFLQFIDQYLNVINSMRMLITSWHFYI